MSLITKQLALDLQVPASRLQNTGNLFVTRPPAPTAGHVGFGDRGRRARLAGADVSGR